MKAKECKNAKFKMLSFCQILFSWYQISHANSQFVYKMYAKYKMPIAKDLVQVEFLVYGLSENTKSL